jgi:hypothetical protein
LAVGIVIFYPLNIAQEYSTPIETIPYNFLDTVVIQQSIDIGSERPEPPKPLAVKIGRYGGQCLAYVQKITGFRSEEFSGYPNRIQPNTTEAKIGYAVLTNEGNVGHIALIKDIQENELTFLESNYYGNGIITNYRKIDINDPIIRGFYKFNL